MITFASVILGLGIAVEGGASGLRDAPSPPKRTPPSAPLTVPQCEGACDRPQPPYRMDVRPAHLSRLVSDWCESAGS
jgi:hypothetical protein